jgi:hypothetical protein
MFKTLLICSIIKVYTALFKYVIICTFFTENLVVNFRENLEHGVIHKITK